MLIDALRKPILASILRDRTVCFIITGASILQISLVILGLPAWQSPIHTFLGIPDPGCGLTRALVALLRADWRTALTLHAFSPLFAAALILIAISATLPQSLRETMVSLVKTLEQNTGLTAILLIALVIYWLIRLLFFREAFLSLIAT
jgi:hypothetical protein